MKKQLTILTLFLLTGLDGLHAQDKLYENTFSLRDVMQR